MIATSLEDIKQAFKENLELEGIDLDSVTENDPLFDSLGLDSIDAIEIIVLLRKKYDIVVDSMQLGKEIFKTFGTLRKYVEENRKK